MKKLILLLTLSFLFAPAVSAQSLGEQLSGTILLQVEEHGEAWYVYPEDLKRYYLKDGEAAYTIMRFLSLGITNTDLEKIPAVANTTEMNDASSVCSSNSLANSLKGKILLQVEEHGEAWYIDVKKCRRIYLRDGEAAYEVMRFLGLGITNENLAAIEVASQSANPPAGEEPENGVQNVPGSQYSRETISANGTFFTVDIVTIDLSAPDLVVITDAVEDAECPDDCPVQELEAYVEQHNGFAAIHGSYFCPADYGGCSEQENYFFAPIFDSLTEELINEEQLPYPTTGSMWVFDADNTVHFIPSTLDFASVRDYEEQHGVIIKAGISNIPPLIVNGQNIVSTQPLDDKQRSTKSSRGAIAVKGSQLYLVIAQSATVPDLAAILESMGVDQAMNLDGGGSSALYYNGEYLVGPGRDLPNAIIFAKK